jgi:hypothetical protein
MLRPKVFTLSLLKEQRDRFRSTVAVQFFSPFNNHNLLSCLIIIAIISVFSANRQKIIVISLSRYQAV